MKDFEDLEAWKAARDFRKEISKLMKTFPDKEKFRFIDQLTHSSRSITANIAEGHGRVYYQENIQYCRQARGSLTETLDHLICSADENYVEPETLLNMRTRYAYCLKLITGISCI